MTRFYKINGKLGSNVLFHAIDRKGYTTNLDEAHIYTEEEANWDQFYGFTIGEDEFFISVEDVNSQAEWHVDHQYIEKTYPEFKDANDEYVAVVKGVFNGNDVAFSDGCLVDFDYNQAYEFTAKQVEQIIKTNKDDAFIFIPKFHTDEIARRTFDTSRITRPIRVEFDLFVPRPE